jgi:TrpR family trp operon transcriptional repressor
MISYLIHHVFLSIVTLMESLNEIARYLADTNNPETIADFLSSMLTLAELETVSKRWELVKLLDQGVSQRKIARELHLSLCKITRGSKELKKENSVLKEAIQKIN